MFPPSLHEGCFGSRRGPATAILGRGSEAEREAGGDLGVPPEEAARKGDRSMTGQAADPSAPDAIDRP
jgi:hypothetical protein